MPFATAWMDLEGSMLSGISQTEKDKYHDFTYMWNLKKKINDEENGNKFINTKNPLMAPDGRGLGDG